MGDHDLQLAALRAKCERLHHCSKGDAQLGRALSGLYYCFKSLKFVPERTKALLSGDYDEAADSGQADEACYYAEAMIRSLHPCGDLVAQVVNFAALASRHGRSAVSLARIREHLPAGDNLEPLLTRLADSREYSYVQEFTNATKHREFVERAVLHSDNHHRIEFAEFKSKSGKTVARRDFEHLVGDAVQLGQMVEAVLDELLSREDPTAGLVPTRTYLPLTATPMMPDYGLGKH